MIDDYRERPASPIIPACAATFRMSYERRSGGSSAPSVFVKIDVCNGQAEADAGQPVPIETFESVAQTSTRDDSKTQKDQE